MSIKLWRSEYKDELPDLFDGMPNIIHAETTTAVEYPERYVQAHLTDFAEFTQIEVQGSEPILLSTILPLWGINGVSKIYTYEGDDDYIILPDLDFTGAMLSLFSEAELLDITADLVAQTGELKEGEYSTPKGVAGHVENSLRLLCFGSTNTEYEFVYAEGFTDLFGFFAGCADLVDLDLQGLTFDEIESSSSMFSRCTSLKGVQLNDATFERLKDSSFMFNGCTSLLEVDLSSADLTGVTDPEYMFADCDDLVTVYCRSQADADIMLSSDGLPTGITFKDHDDHVFGVSE